MACLPQAPSQRQQLQTRSCGKKSHLGVLANLECALTCAVRQPQEEQINAYLFAFRPAGWDNEKKIAILHENFTTVKPEDAYEDFIVKPPVRKVPRSVTLSYRCFPLCFVCLFVFMGEKNL